jgi:hypothetical protein
MALSTIFNSDGVAFTGATVDFGPFTLLGGRYAFGTSAPDTTIALQVLMPDGTTYQNAATPIAAAGFQTYDLPPGSYKFDIVTAAAVQAFLVRVPYRAA